MEKIKQFCDRCANNIYSKVCQTCEWPEGWSFPTRFCEDIMGSKGERIPAAY